MDDLVLLGGYKIPSSNMYNNYGSNRNSSIYGQVKGRSISQEERALLSDETFSYDRKKRSLLSRAAGATFNTFTLGVGSMSTGSQKKGLKNVSRGVTLEGVSQDDYTRLSNLDLFRGGSLSDVTNTGIKSSTYKQDLNTGTVARTKGDALSLLGQADLETLSKVVSGRQGQIVGNTLSPGLAIQGFSLFSGNFGR